MKTVESDITSDAAGALRDCLKDVSFVQVESIDPVDQSGGLRPDLVLHGQLPESSFTILAEVKSSGQPRLAREASNQLLRCLEQYPNAYGIFVAPYVSPRGGQVCKEAGVGYLDLSGNCYLSFDRIHIERTGNPNQYRRKKELRSLYSPKASRVLRVLMENSGRTWKMKDLAAVANVSLGHASNVKQLLEDREWLRTEKDGCRLTRPGELLAEWSEKYSYRDNSAVEYHTIMGLPEIEAEIARTCENMDRKYAFTMFSGAARHGVATRYKRVFAFVDGHLEEVAAKVQLKKVASGPNVILLSPYDDGVFYGAAESEHGTAASPVQVYLDLKNYRGRGEETANALLQEVIQPTW